MRSMAVAARIRIQTSSFCSNSKEHPFLRWDVHLLPQKKTCEHLLYFYLIYSPSCTPAPSVLQQRGLVVGVFGETSEQLIGIASYGPRKVEGFELRWAVGSMFDPK